MANDIKIEGVTAQPALKPAQRQASRVNHQASSPEPKNDVTVSAHLSQLASRLIAENDTHTSPERIAALRYQIENNEYKVDLDALATKLTHTLLSKHSG